VGFRSEQNRIVFVLVVGLMSWLIPGGGYFLLRENRRGTIILVTIALTFAVGAYIGSIGVVDPVGAKLWYLAQILSSPAVAAVGHLTAGGGYPVYGRPAEVGQIYTSIAGLLNLLCIINAAYLAYAGKPSPETD